MHEEKETLRTIWNYMVLDEPIQKCDLILGCGCSNLDIPIKCSKLLKQGYGKNILFTGGLGKITQNIFFKPEAEIYKEIALREGIKEEQIYIENQSQNTGDNFRFSSRIIEENNIKSDKILIVHNKLSERRTLATAQCIMKDKQIFITSPSSSFETFMEKLEKKETEERSNRISLLIGDVQRMLIFPQFGWQIEQEVPTKVLESYEVLKNKGYTKYLFTPDDIQTLMDKYGTVEGMQKCYFY